MSNKKTEKSTRYGFTWWAKNLLIALFAFIFLPKVIVSNAGYEWIWKGYAKDNLEAIKECKGLSYDQIMEAKLGYDYAFLEMIRKSTPDDAVVFYPSRKDFTDKNQYSQVEFSGNLCDKLSAVRFLYPRHVVVKEELGKTSWSKKITHVAVVNGHGLELLPYKVNPATSIAVLPMDSTALQTNK